MAIRGGGKNYCPNSLDRVTSKDNYTDVGGGTMGVAKKSCGKTGYMAKTEAEICNSDEAKEVAKVGVDTTTSDNTDRDITKKVAETTGGKVSMEVLGGTIDEITFGAVVRGADTTLTGVSIYLA